MGKYDLYKDIKERTNGEIYIGLVGPVRTGKSTFIRKFMELFVLPNLKNEYIAKKTQDELPQGSAGTTIMTTEPKFIPNESVEVTISDDLNFKVKMIDCVGYVVEGATGYLEEEGERMVNTPWSKDPMPFTQAANMGTEKVINDHATIGIVMTTDGSVTGIDRENYESAEAKAIDKLKAINKPFIILLNTMYPDSEKTSELVRGMEERYNTKVMPINALKLAKEDINKIFETILYQFPLSEIRVEIPKWIYGLNDEHWFKEELVENLRENMSKIFRVDDIYRFMNGMKECNHIQNVKAADINLGTGTAEVEIKIEDGMLYDILSETTGLDIKGEFELINVMKDLSQMKRKYDKVAMALEQVDEKGYGIVIPRIDELALEEPEIIRQGNKYGVKLRARAPSIHLIRADIETEVAPIVGTQEQSQDLLSYLQSEVESDPQNIWNSNLFGKSLHELVSDELQGKLHKMSDTSQERLQETLQRVINDGSGNLICIIV